MGKDDLLVEAGAKLRELRKITGLSTYKVVKRIGVSGNYIGMIDRGQKNPSEAILASLAEIYEVDRDEIFSLYKRVANDELEQIMQLHPEIRKTMAAISTSKNISDKEAIMIARRLEEITSELFQKEDQMLSSLQQRYNEMAVSVLGYTAAIHFEELILLLQVSFLEG